jgi:hypothetical protein
MKTHRLGWTIGAFLVACDPGWSYSVTGGKLVATDGVGGYDIPVSSGAFTLRVGAAAFTSNLEIWFRLTATGTVSFGHRTGQDHPARFHGW